MNIKNITLVILALTIGSNSFAAPTSQEAKKKITIESLKESKHLARIKYGAKEIIFPLSKAFIQASLAVVIGGLSIAGVKNLFLPHIENEKSPAGFFFKEFNQKTIQGLISILIILAYTHTTGTWTIDTETEQAVDSTLLGSRAVDAEPEMSGGCSGPCCC